MTASQLKEEIRRIIRPYRNPGGKYRRHLTAEEIEQLLTQLTEVSKE